MTRTSDKFVFYSELAKLLGAGFDIRRAASVLRKTRLSDSQVALLDGFDRDLAAGGSIHSSFAGTGGGVSELERNLIGAGERGGSLPAAFQHLADYFQMLTALRREMVRGLIYPLFVLHLGIVIAVVPWGLLEGKSIPAIVGSLAVTLIIVYAVAAVLGVVGRHLVRTAPENSKIDRAINRIPWIGATRRNLAMARFTKVYHSCLLAGIPMRETVKLATDASHSGLIREAGGRVFQTATEGNPLGPAFLLEPAFPTDFSRSYITGEEAGTLDRDLANWSVRFKDDAASAAKTASLMIPKILYFVILGFAAWKIVGFFNGYYTNTLQQFDS